MKKIFKILSYFLLLLLFIVGAAIGLLYYKKDKIIGMIVQEVNKHLLTKVEVEAIDLTIWENFPHMSIVFKNVKIHESIPSSNKLLLSAEKLGANLNILQLIEGKYVIKNVFARKGIASVRFDKNGIGNFNIIKQDSLPQKGTNKKFEIELNKIKLTNFEIIFNNEQKEQSFNFYNQESVVSIKHNEKLTDIDIEGKFAVHGITLSNNTFFKDKKLNLSASLSIDNEQKKIIIKPTSLVVEKSLFELSGSFATDSTAEIDLKIDGINTNINSLLSLLSKNIYDKVSMYKSKGDVYFKGEMKGSLANGNTPEIKVLFGCQNASFYYPGLKKSLQQTSFNGEYIQNDGINSLTINEIKSSLDNKPITGEFKIQNFRDPILNFDISAELDAASILQVYPIKEIDFAKGNINLNFAFEGKLNDLKNEKGKKNINADGEITFKNMEFKMANKSLVYKNFNANLLFNKNDVSINEFDIQIGNSDVKLSGMFKNVIPFLLLKQEDLMIDASISGNHLDLDNLLANHQENTDSKDEYKFGISPWLNLDLNCNYKSLTFRKFKTSNIKGDVKLGNGIVSSTGINVNIAGGNFNLKGTLNASNPHNFKLISNIDAKNINFDSVFYMFEDFNQTFITQKQIQGKFTGNLALNLEFNEHLQIIPSSILADVTVKIANGRLIKFEPLQKLSRFVDDEALKDIQFKEITNQFHVENEMITIPEMVIKSNLNTINISGTHSFKNELNYHLKISLKNYKKKNTTEEETAIENEKNNGGTSLFLKVIGIPPNIKVAYDSKAVKEKIKEKLKEEKKEFLDLFKKENKEEKEKVKKQVEVDENNEINF